MSDDLDDLIKTIDRVVEDHCSRATRTEAELGIWPANLWSALDDIGVTNAMLDEEQGGAGLDFANCMQLLRRCAYHAVPVPLAETYLAGRLLMQSGIAVPKGVLTVAPVVNDQRLESATPADGFLFSGIACAVPWGDRAERILVPTMLDGTSMLALLSTKGGTMRTRLNLAGEPRVDISFDRAHVDICVPSPSIEDRLKAEGALFRSVQMVGALERILEYSVQYANERVQFGRPIGKFQAVQHMLAILAGQVAAAIAAVDMAVDLSTQQADEIAVAIAKSRVGESAGKGSDAAHQVHGAMGFTREHSLHYSTRRLWAWRDEFGGETYWQSRLGRIVAARGGDALWPMLTSMDARHSNDA